MSTLQTRMSDTAHITVANGVRIQSSSQLLQHYTSIWRLDACISKSRLGPIMITTSKHNCPIRYPIGVNHSRHEFSTPFRVNMSPIANVDTRHDVSSANSRTAENT